MTRFICVTCQSIKDDIHIRWTNAGVTTCDTCETPNGMELMRGILK